MKFTEKNSFTKEELQLCSKGKLFNKNDGSVIEMSLKSKIPKAMQVAAATQGDSNIEDIENQSLHCSFKLRCR